MIKKELVVHIQTNEEGEFIKVNALEDPGFFLLSLGQNRMVINGAELVEALQSIGYYATLFQQEALMKEQRAKSPPMTVVASPVTPVKGKRKAAANPEDEGAIVLEPTLRMGPTASELALERQTQHMKGDTIVLTEKKK